MNNNYTTNGNSYVGVQSHGRTLSPNTTKTKQFNETPYYEHDVSNDSRQLALARQSCYCDQNPRAANMCHLNGSAHLTALPVNNQLTHIINSLSSPESAYSTGYSTDGTSPGKIFVMLL